MNGSLPAILGGKRQRDRPFFRRSVIGDAEKQAAMRVLESGELSGFLGAAGPLFGGGPEVRSFERACAAVFEYEHAVTVNSWTTGLTACAGALQLGPGDEFICPTFTMSASAVAPMFCGAVPVLADIEPDSLCLDPASVKRLVTERTRAIMVVHLFGYPAAMKELIEIAAAHNLAIIEDAAQAPGTRHGGRVVGGLTHLGGFSLNFHKHIHTGEGGIIVTNSDELADRCRMIRNHGENAVDSFQFDGLCGLVGSNFRLTEIQAAIGCAQLQRLPAILEKRRENAAILRELLEPLPGIRVPRLRDPADSHSYYAFPFRYFEEETGLRRELFVKAVLAELPGAEHWESIPLAAGYVKPIHYGRVFRDRLGMGRDGFPLHEVSDTAAASYKEGSCPVAERMYSSELLLTGLVIESNGEEEMRDLAHAIKKVLEAAPEIQRAFRDQACHDPELPTEQVGRLAKVD